MISADFHVEHVDYERDVEALRAVREPVFVVEQKVPLELEWDELDPLSEHVLARDLDGNPIGTGRLTPEHKIGRMAVLRDWRGRGVGAALLTRLIERARERHYPAVELHAQVSAIDFYSGFGFQAYGDEFEEAGIQHQHMRLELSPLATREPTSASPSSPSEVLDTDQFDELVRSSIRLIDAARRRLWIYTRDLDPLLLGRPEVLDALKRLAFRAEPGGIRILVHDTLPARQDGHPLIPLSQRLSSAIQLRTPQDEVDRQYAGAFLLDDQGGYLQRPLASRMEATGNMWDPARRRQLQDLFDSIWERSMPCSDLRALEI